MKFDQLNLNRFGYKVVKMTPEETAQYVSSNSNSAKGQVNNNQPSKEEKAPNVLTGTVIMSCFIMTSALPSRVELSGNDARFYDDSKGGGGSISGDSASMRFIRADGLPGALVIQKRHGKNNDAENVFEMFYDESASGGQNNYIFIGRSGIAESTNHTDFVVLHGVNSVRAEINRVHEYQSRPSIVTFDYNKSDVTKDGVVSLLMSEGEDGIVGMGQMAELLTFVSNTSFAVGDTITGNITGATGKIIYKFDAKNFAINHTSYGVNFSTSDNACTTNGAGGGSGTGAFSSSQYINVLLMYTDNALNVRLGNPMLPDSDAAYDIGSASFRIKDIYISGNIIGGSSASPVFWRVGSAVGAGGTLYASNMLASATESETQIPCPKDGTISDLYILIATAQPADDDLTVTFRKAGTDQALTVTIPASATAWSVHSDTTNSFSVSAGDLINVEIVNASGSPSASISQVIFKV